MGCYAIEYTATRVNVGSEMYLSQYIQPFPCVPSSVMLTGKSLALISAVSCIQNPTRVNPSKQLVVLVRLSHLAHVYCVDSHDPGCCVPVLPRRWADTCCVSLSGSHGTPADAEQSAYGYLCSYRDVGTRLGEADGSQYSILNSWKCLPGLFSPFYPITPKPRPIPWAVRFHTHIVMPHLYLSDWGMRLQWPEVRPGTFCGSHTSSGLLGVPAPPVGN